MTPGQRFPNRPLRRSRWRGRNSPQRVFGTRPVGPGIHAAMGTHPWPLDRDELRQRQDESGEGALQRPKTWSKFTESAERKPRPPDRRCADSHGDGVSQAQTESVPRKSTTRRLSVASSSLPPCGHSAFRHSSLTFSPLRCDQGMTPSCCSMPTTMPGAIPCPSAKVRTACLLRGELATSRSHSR